MIKTILFSISMFILLAYPAYMVYQQEEVVNKGELYKFRLAPFDPYDAFRGRYLNLNYNFRNISTSEKFEAGEQAFAKIGLDSLGFAYLFDVSHSKPSSPYLKVKISFQYQGGNLTLESPSNLSRYYINEHLAPQAEQEIQKIRSFETPDDHVDAYAEIKVYKGECNIAELYLQEQPIVQYLRTLEKE